MAFKQLFMKIVMHIGSRTLSICHLESVFNFNIVKILFKVLAQYYFQSTSGNMYIEFEVNSVAGCESLRQGRRSNVLSSGCIRDGEGER